MVVKRLAQGAENWWQASLSVRFFTVLAVVTAIAATVLYLRVAAETWGTTEGMDEAFLIGAAATWIVGHSAAIAYTGYRGDSNGA